MLEKQKTQKTEKVIIDIEKMSHPKNLKNLIQRLTENYNKIEKDQKNLVDYCRILTNDITSIKEKVILYLK